MERLEKNIDKGNAKLKYYMEPADELIEDNDYIEMEITVKKGTQIIDKITDLISQLEGMKFNLGFSGQDVGQWKKDKKNGFSPFIQERDKKLLRYCRLKKQKEKMRSKSKIGRPNGSARSA